MFFGHIAVAFTAKHAVLKVPLWSLLVACEAAADLLSFVFLATGLEKPAQ